MKITTRGNLLPSDDAYKDTRRYGTGFSELDRVHPKIGAGNTLFKVEHTPTIMATQTNQVETQKGDSRGAEDHAVATVG